MWLDAQPVRDMLVGFPYNFVLMGQSTNTIPPTSANDFIYLFVTAWILNKDNTFIEYWFISFTIFKCITQSAMDINQCRRLNYIVLYVYCRQSFVFVSDSVAYQLILFLVNNSMKSPSLRTWLIIRWYIHVLAADYLGIYCKCGQSGNLSHFIYWKVALWRLIEYCSSINWYIWAIQNWVVTGNVFMGDFEQRTLYFLRFAV